MKNMALLIDTNIIMDVILKREPFFEKSDYVYKICRDKKASGYLAAHTITNFFYSARKYFSVDERRGIVLRLFKIFKVIPIDEEKLLAATQNYEFKDFEDCLQVECAKAVEADYIITRDKNDFQKSEIEAITPEEFCKMFEDNEDEDSEDNENNE